MDSKKKQAVMLDTMIFDKLINDKSLLEKLPKDNILYYATNIQQKQIDAIPDENRKDLLLSLFEKTIIKIKSIDKHWFGFRNNFHNTRFISEKEREDKQYLSNQNKNHLSDVLILLTAKSKNMLMVTDDEGTPFKRARQRNYTIISLDEFIKQFS